MKKLGNRASIVLVCCGLMCVQSSHAMFARWFNSEGKDELLQEIVPACGIEIGKKDLKGNEIKALVLPQYQESEWVSELLLSDKRKMLHSFEEQKVVTVEDELMNELGTWEKLFRKISSKKNKQKDTNSKVIKLNSLKEHELLGFIGKVYKALENQNITTATFASILNQLCANKLFFKRPPTPTDLKIRIEKLKKQEEKDFDILSSVAYYMHAKKKMENILNNKDNNSYKKYRAKEDFRIWQKNNMHHMLFVNEIQSLAVSCKNAKPCRVEKGWIF